MKVTSGSSALDAATCRLLRERGQFEPDQAARQPRIARLRIRWVLPTPTAQPAADLRFTTVFPVDARETLRPCRRMLNGSDNDTLPQCSFFNAVADKYIARLKREGRAVANHELVFETANLLGGRDTASSIGTGHDELLLNLVAVSIAIDETGKVGSCDPIELVGAPDEAATEMCNSVRQWDYEPLDPATTNRSARNMVKYSAVLLRKSSD